jgi:hypothetical protein
MWIMSGGSVTATGLRTSYLPELLYGVQRVCRNEFAANKASCARERPGSQNESCDGPEPHEALEVRSTGQYPALAHCRRRILINVQAPCSPLALPRQPYSCRAPWPLAPLPRGNSEALRRACANHIARIPRAVRSVPERQRVSLSESHLSECELLLHRPDAEARVCHYDFSALIKDYDSTDSGMDYPRQLITYDLFAHAEKEAIELSRHHFRGISFTTTRQTFPIPNYCAPCNAGYGTWEGQYRFDQEGRFNCPVKFWGY